MKNSVIKKRTRTASKSDLAAPIRLKVLVTIVERSKTDFYLDVLEGYEVNMQMVLYGRGTAPNDILQYLGLTSIDKAVIISVVKESRIKEILTSYEERFFKTKNGKGIAFSVPMSSIIGVSLYQFLANNYEGGR